jgi:hypothetical protein
MLEIFDAHRLAGAPPDSIGDLLEQGNIVQFSPNPIELPGSGELEKLRSELPKQLKLKNVSYHPEADRVKGLDEDSPVAELAYRTLTNHRDRVTGFLEQIMPTLTRGMQVGTCSFRPMQEQGRNLKAHASNELVHVDAGAYGATNGNRLLRFFVNVNPVEDRVWSTKGAMPELLERYGKQAGMTRSEIGRLDRNLLDRLRSSALSGISKAGLPLATVLDSSPYDRAMRRFHNFMKDTPAFQADPVGHHEFRFPPFSAWMVFTDMVSHACLSGQHALIYTAVLPLENCRRPELAPINLLRAAA